MLLQQCAEHLHPQITFVLVNKGSCALCVSRQTPGSIQGCMLRGRHTSWRQSPPRRFGLALPYSCSEAPD